MTYHLSKPDKELKGKIALTASKSESNRVLIIQALCKDKFLIKNLAEAEDTKILAEILHSEIQNQEHDLEYDVGPAGTTMRFLTAYFATQPGTRILTGSERMKQRPIGVLVDALRQLGANIEYLEKEGFPPLKIHGTLLHGGEIEVDVSVSSQYVSALLLIAPQLHNGLVIRFKNQIVSRPYIDMTLKIMEHFGVYGQWQDNLISVSKQSYFIDQDINPAYVIEADWSSASYWYNMAALAEDVDLTLTGLKKESLQGDAIIPNLFNFFGVRTRFTDEGILLTKSTILTEQFGFDFSNCPDIAQTLAVTVSALAIPSLFNGLQTLKIKETDRVFALKKELERLGVVIKDVLPHGIEITPTSSLKELNDPIETYEDHRMAMAFASLAMKLEKIKIKNPQVVSKSYPNFWNDLKSVGFLIRQE